MFSSLFSNRCWYISLSSIFRNELSDFALGFCEGVSVVLILSSAIYLIRYFVKRNLNNPYKTLSYGYN